MRGFVLWQFEQPTKALSEAGNDENAQQFYDIWQQEKNCAHFGAVWLKVNVEMAESRGICQKRVSLKRNFCTYFGVFFTCFGLFWRVFRCFCFARIRELGIWPAIDRSAKRAGFVNGGGAGAGIDDAYCLACQWRGVFLVGFSAGNSGERRQKSFPKRGLSANMPEGYTCLLPLFSPIRLYANRI